MLISDSKAAVIVINVPKDPHTRMLLFSVVHRIHEHRSSEVATSVNYAPFVPTFNSANDILDCTEIYDHWRGSSLVGGHFTSSVLASCWAGLYKCQKVSFWLGESERAGNREDDIDDAMELTIEYLPNLTLVIPMTWIICDH